MGSHIHAHHDNRYRHDERDNYYCAHLASRFSIFVALQNFVTSLKWKLLIFMAGTTISNDSSPAERTAGPSISTFASASITLWLKRKLRMPPDTRPFSMRNVPSRVMPVRTFSYGSTSRMYQRRVTRIPRSVERIISSTDLSPPEKTRFMGASPNSFGRVKPWPVGFVFIFFAVARE